MISKKSAKTKMNEKITSHLKYNDDAVLHFSVLALVVLNAFAHALLNLVIFPIERREKIKEERRKLNNRKKFISSLSNGEINSIVTALDNELPLNRNELIDSALSNSGVFEKIEYHHRRIQLMKKNNKELKDMLIGIERVSKLKKSQLVDTILSSEYSFIKVS